MSLEERLTSLLSSKESITNRLFEIAGKISDLESNPKKGTKKKIDQLQSERNELRKNLEKIEWSLTSEFGEIPTSEKKEYPESSIPPPSEKKDYPESSIPPPSVSELKTSTAYDDPAILEAAIKMARTPDEIKTMIPILNKLRDEMMKSRIHTVGALAEVRRELEEANKPKSAFQLKEIKEVLDENPDLAEDIYEEVQKAYAKGELTKDEYTTIKKVIPSDLKDVTAFKVKRKSPKYKSVSKKEILGIRRKKSKSPRGRRRNF